MWKNSRYTRLLLPDRGSSRLSYAAKCDQIKEKGTGPSTRLLIDTCQPSIETRN